MTQTGPGWVSLVGAGPGDPGLLTVRGRRALERADVVLYDHLASPSLMASIPAGDQERIHVGKRAQAGQAKQEEINRLLVQRAQSGARVVRLKGGDPFVFGRGGEEAAACVAAGIPFEIIPGVSAVSAVPAYAGIPLTDRRCASGFTALTGHERWDVEKNRVDWQSVAGHGGTIVVLMGVLQVTRWSRGLMAGGHAADTPVALVRWGTTPQQQTWSTTLGEVAALIANENIRPPVVAIVGGVTRLREELMWFENRPLHGRVVGLTRSKTTDLHAFEMLEDKGATLIHMPLTRVRPVEASGFIPALVAEDVTDVMFTSANGAVACARELADAGYDARVFAGRTLWAVGRATAESMRRELGVGADRMAKRASAQGLVETAAEEKWSGRHVMFPAALAARDTLAVGLRALGARVSQFALYETCLDPLGPSRLESAREQGLNTVVVASPSAVNALVEALDNIGWSRGALDLAAIGPTTAAHAQGLGCHVAWVPEDSSIAGLARVMATTPHSTRS